LKQVAAAEGLKVTDRQARGLLWAFTRCGRISLGKKKINFSTVFAVRPPESRRSTTVFWLVSFMDYDLGYFDLETRVLEPLENPFGPKL